MTKVPARYLAASDRDERVPVHVVWELTLACNLKCVHCGSRAGKRRAGELSTAECLKVVSALAALGTREISLIGGEAYLRKDWLEIVAAIRSHGIYCALQTGARHLTRTRLAAAAAAGLSGIGVSIDGPRSIHDKLRGVTGSFDDATRALTDAHDLGLRTSVNTQICTANRDFLKETYHAVLQSGATHWQVQLTVAMGNAVDNDALILQPFHLLEVMPTLAELYLLGLDDGVLLIPGNNIGYFGPYEHLWRAHSGGIPHWSGCSAAETVIGIEADGTFKGCPSLETTTFAEGNVLNSNIADLWAKAQPVFSKRQTQPRAKGFCDTCFYADVCRAGCTWTGHSLLGEVGDNPYCHYRALKLQELGYNEIVEKTADAPQASFGIGRFAVVRRPAGSPVVSVEDIADDTVGVRPKAREHLLMCEACNCFHSKAESICPFCGANVDASSHAAREAARRVDAVIELIDSKLR